jgi:hypothetical protein
VVTVEAHERTVDTTADLTTDRTISPSQVNALRPRGENMTRWRRTIRAALILGTMAAAHAALAEPRPATSGQAMVAPGQGAGGPPANPIDYATARFERVISAVRINEPITIDGRLTEPAWELAQAATDFRQWQPHPGMPASERTEVRFLYDDNNLYIGARCFESDPKGMTVNELREDFDSQESDLFGLFLDTLHDRQSGYFLSTNPAGARRDTQVSNDGTQSNLDWDGVWDVKATIDEEGWTAEFVIPFKTLRFSKSPTQEWGLNLLRRIKRNNEESHWSPLPRRFRLTRASMAGTLTGLHGIRQGRNLKLKPYVISSVTEVGTSAGARDLDGDAGLDLKYGLGPSMTLDLTYRTEFSQVEVDQQQVNLTRFNLFFPEKREFFLENAGTFTIAGGGGVRGSGGTGNVIPFFSRRIGLSSSGTPVPIVGGARLSGKTGTYDVGMLAINTQHDGTFPSNTFLVGHLRKTLRGSSTAGAIVTSRHSPIDGDHNQLYGVDTFLRFFEKLEITSYLLQTTTPGRSGQNQARLLETAWRDEDLTVSGLYEQVQPNFNPEAGLVRRANMTHYSGDVSWRPRPRRSAYIRNYNLDASTDYYADEHGHIETRDYSVGTGILFHNSASIRFTMTETFERLREPFAIRSNVIIAPGDYTFRRYAVNVGTDRSRAIGGSVNASVGEFWDGQNRSASGSLEFKPSIHFNMDLNASRNHVTLPAGEFSTTLVGSRMLLAFNTKTFLSSYLQYNATTNQFTSNTRFNIIHRPMSDLYLVYNERRDTVSGSRLERAVIVKFTYLYDF